MGIAWVLAAAIAVLLPALVHGASLGPYDVLTQAGLSAQPGIVVHSHAQVDLVDAIIPWNAQVWSLVHHGQVPLWNPYNGLGLPLAFNWQSAPLGLPALVGYLFPLHLAFTAGVIVTTLVAGTGAYAFARLLGLGPMASALAGTVFELSGPMQGWLGYPLASVMSWAGWIFAVALLLLRGRRPVRDICLFAVLLALSIYAGQPESLAVMLLSLAVFVAVVLAAQALREGLGSTLRPLLRLVVGGIGGACLGAPLALPGFQLATASGRSAGSSALTVPPHALAYLLFQGFDGLPIAGNRVFGVSIFYPEYSAYVGVVAAVLVAVGIAVLRRRPEVVALTAVLAVTLVLAYVPVVNSAMSDLPAVGKVAWIRSLMPMAFVVAILAGFGLDQLQRARRTTPARVATAGFAVGALVLLGVWLFGRGHLPADEAAIRDHSFVWPAIAVVVGMSIAVAIWLANRGTEASRDGDDGSRLKFCRLGTASLLALETVFLVTAGTPIVSSSSRFLTPTPAELALRRVVGSGVVGYGQHTCNQLGIPLNVNGVYGVHEFDAYDPIIPNSYYYSWYAASGTPAGVLSFNLFCPAVTTAALARLFGVGFVLEPSGSSGPIGGVFVTRIGDEDLYRIPGAAIATLTAVPADGALPPDSATGTPVTVSRPNNITWDLTTSSPTAQVLRLRLSDVPGWHASIDGHSLQLESFNGVMMQAVVPPGRHNISLRYWPDTLTTGLVLAILGVLGLALLPVVVAIRRRRDRHPQPMAADVASFVPQLSDDANPTGGPE